MNSVTGNSFLLTSTDKAKVGPKKTPAFGPASLFYHRLRRDVLQWRESNCLCPEWRLETSRRRELRALQHWLLAARPRSVAAMLALPTCHFYWTHCPCGSGFVLSTTGRWSRFATFVARSATYCATRAIRS